MMGVLNFAHASFYMLGAFFGLQISRWVGFWPALVLAPLLVGVLGALVERYGLRRVHQHGHVAELLFTFGLAYRDRGAGAADLGQAAGRLSACRRRSTSRSSRLLARNFPPTRCS